MEKGLWILVLKIAQRLFQESLQNICYTNFGLPGMMQA